MAHAVLAEEDVQVSGKVGVCERSLASIAQLGERQTEDLKVLGSIPSRGRFCLC